MKRFFALLIFSALLSAGAFAQESYADKAEEAAETAAVEQSVFREDLLGFGLSILGPEISYSYRKNHLQIDAAIAATFIPDLYLGDENYLMFWPKFDVGYNFFPQGTPSIFLGGFIPVPLIFKLSGPPVFYPALAIGADASILFRLGKNVELSVTSYLPVPLMQGLGSDPWVTVSTIYIMALAPLLDITVDLRFRL